MCQSQVRLVAQMAARFECLAAGELSVPIPSNKIARDLDYIRDQIKDAHVEEAHVVEKVIRGV